MTLLVKCLPHEHEDLHLTQRHLFKAQLGIPIILVLERQELEGELLLHNLLAPGLVRDSALEVRWRAIKKNYT